MRTSVLDKKNAVSISKERFLSIRSETADLLTASLLIFGSIWYISEALSFPTRGSAWVQAHTFPIGIGALAILSAVVLAALAIYRILTQKRAEKIVIHKPGIVFVGLLCTVSYAVALGGLGFYLTSALFTLVFGYAAGIRKVWSLAALTLGFLVFTKIIFDMALGTPLPTGTWL